jgi:hypothetical protein
MRVIKTILLVSGLALLPLIVTAQSIEDMQQMPMEERRALRESMSDEEFAEKRKQWRSEFEKLSDEEKQAIREKRSTHRSQNRKLARERWESMSEEERAAAREKHQGKGKKGNRKGHGKGGKNKGDKPLETDMPTGTDQSSE